MPHIAGGEMLRRFLKIKPRGKCCSQHQPWKSKPIYECRECYPVSAVFIFGESHKLHGRCRETGTKNLLEENQVRCLTHKISVKLFFRLNSRHIDCPLLGYCIRMIIGIKSIYFWKCYCHFSKYIQMEGSKFKPLHLLEAVVSGVIINSSTTETFKCISLKMTHICCRNWLILMSVFLVS